MRKSSGILGARPWLLALLLVAAVALPAFGAADAHGALLTNLLIALTVILVGAQVGGDLAVRFGQPSVLGELLVGVLLGNLALAGVGFADAWKSDLLIDILAQIGVIVLLFEVGLESTVRDMLRVGPASFLVAVLGVIAPFALGWGVGVLVLPEHSAYAHAFLGATLTATSVGITARVLKDLGRSKSPEARVILGAAVIDDVLGLVILALVSGIIVAANTGGALSTGSIVWILAKAVLFLFGAIAVGLVVSPRLFSVASRLRGRGVLLAIALAFCFVLAWAAGRIGLAPIVGAYAAGLILEDVHFRELYDKGSHQLEELIQPISTFLVPIFFVVMGMRVDLTTFARPEILGLAGLLTVAAIVGKQACSLGAIGGGLDRLSIGIGMIPRGEVGLIFANIGLGLVLAGERIIDEGVYSAVVIMVIVTTMATPPALKWSLQRGEARRDRARAASG